MKLHFSIHYRAQWGEDVCVELILHAARSLEVSLLLRMETTDGTLWQTDYRVMETHVRQFSYRYCVYRGEEVVRREWARAPRIFDADAGRDYLCNDFWMDTPPRPWLFDNAFNEAAARPSGTDLHTPTFAQTILLRVLAHTLAPGEAVAVIGSQPPLGDWRPERALRLTPMGLCEWRLALSTAALQMPFEYKFVIVDEATGELLCWEEGANRVCDSAGSYSGEVSSVDAAVRRQRQGHTTIIRNDGLVRLPELTAPPAAVVKSAAADATANAAAAIEVPPPAPIDAAPLLKLIDLAAELGLNSISMETLQDVVDGMC